MSHHQWRGIGGLYAYGKCPITLRPQTQCVRVQAGTPTPRLATGSTQPATRRRPLSGRSHGAAGAMGRLHPRLQLCRCAAG
ncbi:hypothetical protein JB92DRAFT_3005640 [Gautieria morchelliformis]|nr:hypothetical protein JB92DRAFT_3005640 [Gautieria morchelliformis]